MNADSFFAIGKSHTVCQDYARSGKYGHGRAFGVVSDGCSSSPDTDVGARALTLSAITGLESYRSDFAPHLLGHLPFIAANHTQGLPLSCLDATLLMVYEREDGLIQTLATGDGVILARERQSRAVWTWEIDYAGFPGYLSYLLDPRRLDQYLVYGHGKRTTTKRCTQGPDMPEVVTRQIGFDPASFLWAQTFDPHVFDLVLVLTDGVLSFVQEATRQSVPLFKVVPQVMDIRVPTGVFLQRAEKFFLAKTCPKLGWQHLDDFGAAAIYCEDPKGETNGI